MIRFHKKLVIIIIVSYYYSYYTEEYIKKRDRYIKKRVKKKCLKNGNLPKFELTRARECNLKYFVKIGARFQKIDKKKFKKKYRGIIDKIFN